MHWVLARPKAWLGFDDGSDYKCIKGCIDPNGGTSSLSEYVLE